MEEQIREIMADILNVEASAISDSFSPDDSPTWDSFNNLRMITAFEEEFGIKFTMSEIQTMTNYRVIKSVVDNYISQS